MIRLFFILCICQILEGTLVVAPRGLGISLANHTFDKDHESDRLSPLKNRSVEQKMNSILKGRDIEEENDSSGNLENGPVLNQSDPSVQTEDADDISCDLSDDLYNEIKGYKRIVNRIIKYVMNGDFRGKTYEILAEMTDTFGARMSGSKELEASIDWVMKRSRSEGLQNTHPEPVRVPYWVRNNESLFLLHPRRHRLSLLGLGSSVGTPGGGIVGQVFVARSFQELEENPLKAKGKIVVFNPSWTNYHDMAQYRVYGASRAAKVGAVATLIRSLTPFSINSPHTGWQLYDESAPRIPTACITIEDVEMLQRYQDRGQQVLLHLSMGAQNLPDVISRNTVTEHVGSELPEEVVVVSGHLDSWDVGVGAMDDGGGSIISLVAPIILKRLGLRARRTIRTVLFTGEEQGLYGGKAYYKKHSADKDKFQLVLESDSGTFDPRGISFSGNEKAKCILKHVLSLMKPIGTIQLKSPMNGGPDIIFWQNAGVPTGSLLNSNDKYFWFHHSEGDTMSVEEPETLDKGAALWTAVAYVVADLNITLPR